MNAEIVVLLSITAVFIYGWIGAARECRSEGGTDKKANNRESGENQKNGANGEKDRNIAQTAVRIPLWYPSLRFIIKQTVPLKRLNESAPFRKAAALNPWESAEEAAIRHMAGQAAPVAGGILAVTVLYLVYSLYSAALPENRGEMFRVDNGYYIQKGEPGEEKTAVIRAVMEGKEGTRAAEFEVTVPDRQPDAQEREELFSAAEEYIRQVWLGNNVSADQVRTNLNLLQIIPNSYVKVRWKAEDPLLVSAGGTVRNVELPEEGAVTKLTAELKLGEENRNLEFLIHILPLPLTGEERMKRQLVEQIESEAARNPQEDTVLLPDNLEGTALKWQTESGDPGGYYPAVLALIIIGGIFGSVSETNRKMKARKVQMAADYPEIISRLSLYLGAGMSIRSAWERMADEYTQMLGRNGKRKDINRRYAFEEMKLTLNELLLGASQEEAFERFGRRTGEIAYVRLGSLLAQNVRKGNERLTALMETEEAESFARRKEEAKEQGEEAGTKLLAPMMGILIIIIAIVMIPAFRSMSL